MDQSRWAPNNGNADNAANARDDSLPSGTSLSANAATFAPAPAPPPPDVSSLDDFSQTGAGQDDLFDEVVPVDQSMRIRSEDDLFNDDFTPAEQPIVEQPPTQPVRGVGERGRGRARGRGRGRGGAPAVRGAVNGQDKIPQQIRAQRSSPPPEDAPTGPRRETTTSVRGDRQATGGVRKPKLSEEELAEKMAKIQIKNASLTAAHARAEADAASFAKREQENKQKSAQRQKEERRDRQQMMGEREKNRMRKLKAMEGREWDVEKNEDDFSKGGRFDKRGGFSGDREDYTDGREYLYREPRGGGNRGGRGGGRGAKAQDQTAPKQDEFPALPATSKPSITSPLPQDGAGEGKSWADQVESSSAT